jgi:hypothetical protein
VDHDRALADQPHSAGDPVGDGRVRVYVVSQYCVHVISGRDAVQLGANSPRELPIGIARVWPDICHVVHPHAGAGLVRGVIGEAAVRDLMLFLPGEQREGAVVPEGLLGVPGAIRRVLAQRHETLR